MQVDEDAPKSALPSPKDPGFLDALPEPLRAIANAATQTQQQPRDVASLLDALEADLRQHVLNQLCDDNKKNESNMGEQWKNATLLCWHLVYMAQQGEDNSNNKTGKKDDDNKNDGTATLNPSSARDYTGLTPCRKLPIVMLDDILESYPLDDALHFFNTHAKPLFPYLFGKELWGEPTAKARPCGLPFLRLANQFMGRLGAHACASSPTTTATTTRYHDAIASVMLTLCQIYPLSEKSATRVWGSYNDQAVTDFEDRDEFEREQAPLLEFGTQNKNDNNDENDDDDDDGAIPDYTVYESFWKLQTDLSRPNSVHLGEFLQRLRSLLTTLEHTPIQTTRTTKQTPPNETNPPNNRLEASTHRYLTKSRLLSIQLQDADFRVPILSQVLIVCHHLIGISPIVLRGQLAEWETRANTLLQQASPRVHAELQSVLGGEEAWRQWKRNKCLPDLDQRHSEPLVGRKRKHPRGLGGSLDGDSDDENDRKKTMTTKDLSLDNLPQVSRDMRKAAPSLDSHIEEYIDALDPEAGIEVILPAMQLWKDGIASWWKRTMANCYHHYIFSCFSCNWT